MAVATDSGGGIGGGGGGGTKGKKDGKKESKKDQMFSVYRPNTGLQFRQESLAELEKKYKKVNSITCLYLETH